MNIHVFVRSTIEQLQTCAGTPRPFSVPALGSRDDDGKVVDFVEITPADWTNYPGIRSKCKMGKVKGGGPLLSLFYRTGDKRDYPMTLEQADEWAKLAEPPAPEPPPFLAPSPPQTPHPVRGDAPFVEHRGDMQPPGAIPKVPPTGVKGG